MGDEVAPRKDFITNNALNVINLDIWLHNEFVNSLSNRREFKSR